MDRKIIIDRINELLAERGWTVYQLEKECDVSKSNLYSLMEEESNQFPTVETISQICEAFNITLAEFFTREPLQYELTEIEGAVIDSMRKCDRAGRERIKAYAEGVAGL